MKLKKYLPALLAAAMLPAMPALATVDSRVTSLNLIIRIQGDVTMNGDIETGKVIVARVGPKQILEMLADALETTFPAGASLYITLEGDVLVVDKNLDVLEDVSEYISANFNLEASLFSGTYNVETEQENSVITFPFSLLLNIPASGAPGARIEEQGLYLELEGIAREVFTASKPKTDGEQIFRGTITSELAGGGIVGDETAYVDGTISLSGKEVDEGMAN